MIPPAQLDAVRRVLSTGGRIAFPPALGEPDLVAHLPSLLGTNPTELVVPYRLRAGALTDLGPNVSIRAWFAGGQVDGLDYAPGLFDRLPRALGAGGDLPLDIAIVRLSPPNEDGLHNVGPCASVVGELVRAARVVVAEIDPDLPWAEGDTTVAAAEITLSVDAEQPLRLPPEAEPSPAAEADRRLAANVAALIPDGAHVQAGVGRTTQTLVSSLGDHRDLKVHTGLISPAIRELIESPAVDPRWVPRFGQAMGPASLMSYIDHNTRISFHSTRYMHDLSVISTFDRFYTVNSTLAVDLLGRLSSEGSARRPRAGLGGLVDFLVAGRAGNGANIIALRATTRSGSARIVDLLPSAEVSVPSYLVDYVVTEHGVADIRGATRGECAERIIALADPAHRDPLEESFRKLMSSGNGDAARSGELR